jgi:hypothetical protein
MDWALDRSSILAFRLSKGAAVSYGYPAGGCCILSPLPGTFKLIGRDHAPPYPGTILSIRQPPETHPADRAAWFAGSPALPLALGGLLSGEML